MDQDFLKQLEQEVTDVGTDEFWKRQIGNKLIWLSPVTTSGQTKVREVMMSDDLGSNSVYEAKKITLSQAIVGINQLDLRPYRKSKEPIFPVFDSRVGAEVKVDLPTYILYKISDWGSEFVDATFDVFADLMALHKKDILKEIKFEGTQDPMAELAEIEDRAAIIREQLNLPPKVEFQTEKESKEAPPKAPLEPPPPEATKVAFDPFERAPSTPKASETPIVKQPPVQNVPVPVQNIPVPVQNIPVPIPAAMRAAEYAAAESSPTNPFRATPSVPNDVVEQKLPKNEPVTPPIINPNMGSVNPRFRPQR
jgi:hypothetical protein